MDDTRWDNTIDMAFGPDGKLYTLEYGRRWNYKNLDAKLSRIDFNIGNRVPKIVFEASKNAGATPLSVNFSAGKSKDPDGDAISYELNINGQVLKSDNGEFAYTFDKAGIFRPSLTVKDAKGASSTAEVNIIAGNEPPVIDIVVEGDDHFVPGGSSPYQITITDKEDGSTADGKISSDRVRVTLDFHSQGFDMTRIAQGHQRLEAPGKLLMAQSDCKSCHLMDERSAGPSYRDVAKRYVKDVRAVDLLSDKILKGGSGVWGDVAMAAHPQLTKIQAAQIVEYILSLAKEDKVVNLPLSGLANFAIAPQEGLSPTSAYVLTVTYEDQGANGMPSLSAFKQFVFKAPEKK
jgi:cytochrome c